MERQSIVYIPMSDILPDHVVVIPDGNRRYAKEHNLPSILGHKKGYERANELITEAKKLGIPYLTLWAFSTENWNRAEEEVKDLLALIEEGLKEIEKKMHREKGRFVHLGRKDRLGNNLVSLIEKLEQETKNYNDFCLSMAIDYGGEDEIRRAEAKVKAHLGGSVFDHLDTTRHSLPCPDLIIRTSGEHRTSGFMPLQSLYSEWYFEDLPFPLFDASAFRRALSEYEKRERRFGK